MSLTNANVPERSFEVVYWGPPYAGKRTNFEQLMRAAGQGGKLPRIGAGEPYTFELIPARATPDSPKLRLGLRTISGQVILEASKPTLLRGVDGVVFVADSQEVRMDANQAALEELRELLEAQGQKLEELPFVLQLNKRDRPTALPVEVATQILDVGEGVAVCEAIALRAQGVQDTLARCSELLIAAAGPAGA